MTEQMEDPKVRMAAVDLAALDLEYRLQIGMRLSRGDTECAVYLRNNYERLLPHLLVKAFEDGDECDITVSKFANAVHERHERGESLN